MVGAQEVQQAYVCSRRSIEVRADDARMWGLKESRHPLDAQARSSLFFAISLISVRLSFTLNSKALQPSVAPYQPYAARPPLPSLSPSTALAFHGGQLRHRGSHWRLLGRRGRAGTLQRRQESPGQATKRGFAARRGSLPFDAWLSRVQASLEGVSSYIESLEAQWECTLTRLNLEQAPAPRRILPASLAPSNGTPAVPLRLSSMLLTLRLLPPPPTALMGGSRSLLSTWTALSSRRGPANPFLRMPMIGGCGALVYCRS